MGTSFPCFRSIILIRNGIEIPITGVCVSIHVLQRQLKSLEEWREEADLSEFRRASVEVEPRQQRWHVHRMVVE